MTRYEELTHKAELCLKASYDCSGEKMSRLWIHNAFLLLGIREDLTIEEAAKETTWHPKNCSQK